MEPPRTSSVSLRSPSRNDYPAQQGYSCSAEAPNKSSPEYQSPSVEREHEAETIPKECSCVCVDTTPEFGCNFGGGGGGGTTEEREKTKEVRKLFPLFYATTWTKQARHAGHTPSHDVQENGTSRKRWVECHGIPCVCYWIE